MYRSLVTKLNISNKEMNDTMKIVKLLEKSGLLIKGVRNEEKKAKSRIPWDFLGTLGTSLLVNL